jgi:hypothetical protein
MENSVTATQSLTLELGTRKVKQLPSGELSNLIDSELIRSHSGSYYHSPVYRITQERLAQALRLVEWYEFKNLKADCSDERLRKLVMDKLLIKFYGDGMNFWRNTNAYKEEELKNSDRFIQALDTIKMIFPQVTDRD